MKEMIYDYGGNPLVGWLTSIYLFLTNGMNPLAVLLALVTLWLTIEKVRSERANRKILEKKIENIEKNLSNWQEL
jgi:hypothetical protein